MSLLNKTKSINCDILELSDIVKKIILIFFYQNIFLQLTGQHGKWVEEIVIISHYHFHKLTKSEIFIFSYASDVFISYC